MRRTGWAGGNDVAASISTAHQFHAAAALPAASKFSVTAVPDAAVTDAFRGAIPDSRPLTLIAAFVASSVDVGVPSAFHSSPQPMTSEPSVVVVSTVGVMLLVVELPSPDAPTGVTMFAPVSTQTFTPPLSWVSPALVVTDTVRLPEDVTGAV